MKIQRFVWILIFFILVTAIKGAAVSIEVEKADLIPLPAALQIKADAKWLEIFREELGNSYRKSYLLPASLDMLAAIMADQDFPVDPYQAASQYFGLAKNLDLQLKQGMAANQIKLVTRKIWKEVLISEKQKQEFASASQPAQAAGTDVFDSFLQLDKLKSKIVAKDEDMKEKKEKLTKLETEKPTPKPKPEKTLKPDKTPKPDKTSKPNKTSNKS